ncbi:hypothetical protein ECC02_001532 [Trypanosoma cruzi]|uniref:Dispersed protein family protein 1 (DGF-1) n=1 Tax=Trypanosoma cruzi TaxID=5693 RepID=A0A7J6YF17_TRYCR|nr:hypothetical protein ECC02_001532 [Trypanosoma cruzi]
MWRRCFAPLLACWWLAAWRCRRPVRCTWTGCRCRRRWGWGAFEGGVQLRRWASPVDGGGVRSGWFWRRWEHRRCWVRRLRQGHALLRARDGVCEHEERCVRVRVRQWRARRGVRACGSSCAAACRGHCAEYIRPRGRDGAVGVRCACRCERGDAAPRCAGRRESGALRAVDGAGRRADCCGERVAAERCRAVRDGRWSVARCGSGGERRERAGGAVGVRCGGAERCACADRHVPRGVRADGDGLPAGCREVDAACVSSRLAVLAVRTGAGAVGPAARAVRAGCVWRGPRDRDDWWADGGGGRRRAGACRWRCRAGRGCVRWRRCVVRECARGCVWGRCAARVGEPGVRRAWVGV